MPWVDAPPSHALRRARQLLQSLRAIRQLPPSGDAGEDSVGAGLSDEAFDLKDDEDDDVEQAGMRPGPRTSDGADQMVADAQSVGSARWQVTARGVALAALPAHPRLAHALLLAAALDARGRPRVLPADGATNDGAASCVDLACALAALVEERDVLEGGGRTHGADARKRLRAILAASPGAGVAGRRWRRARETCRDMKRRVDRGSSRMAAQGAAGEAADEEADEADEAADASAFDGGVHEMITSADAMVGAGMYDSARMGGGGDDDDGAMGLAAQLAASAFAERVAQLQPGKPTTLLLANRWRLPPQPDPDLTRTQVRQTPSFSPTGVVRPSSLMTSRSRARSASCPPAC